MGRLFSCVMLSLMLLPAARQPLAAQPVFFSILFPQLVPQTWTEAGEAEGILL